MKVQMTIPMDTYHVLEKSCADNSEEAVMLKNGLIEEGGRAVTILCQPEQASTILAWANQKDPEGSSLITIASDT
jgi:hypothetical protein